MKLEFTYAAMDDLRSIRAYTLERWGNQQEEIYLEALWAKFEEIIDNPEIGKSRSDLFPGCQMATEGKHVILYRLQAEVLQIVRILHGAMDYPRHIPVEFRKKTN